MNRPTTRKTCSACGQHNVVHYLASESDVRHLVYDAPQDKLGPRRLIAHGKHRTSERHLFALDAIALARWTSPSGTLVEILVPDKPPKRARTIGLPFFFDDGIPAIQLEDIEAAYMLRYVRVLPADASTAIDATAPAIGVSPRAITLPPSLSALGGPP